MKLERWDEALNALQQATQISKANNDNDIVRYHQALILFGDYYSKRNDLKNAIQYYQQAIEIAEKGNFYTISSELYSKLSQILKLIKLYNVT